MNSEILSLDRLVRSIVDTKDELIDDCPDHYSRLVEQMHMLADLTQENILKKMLGVSDDHQRKIFIQFHQRHFISLSDELVNGYSDDIQAGFHLITVEISKLSLAKQFYNCLQKLLVYIAKNFPGYICFDIEIPLAAKAMIASAAAKMLKDLKKRFADTGVNERLSKLILDVVMKNIDISCRNALTFQRSNWLLNFLMEVRDILDHKPDAAQRRLHMLLCTHNLNHCDVLEYSKHTIHSKIDQIDSITCKIDKLALIRKRINQFTYIEDRVYDTSLPDMKGQLNNWISEEISYLENYIALGLSEAEALETAPQKTLKIQFDLNTQELACMMNIAETVGVVKTRNKKNFMRTASQAFATANQEMIDIESLHTLYYKTSMPVLKTVRDKFIDMMNETNKRLAQIKK